METGKNWVKSIFNRKAILGYPDKGSRSGYPILERRRSGYHTLPGGKRLVQQLRQSPAFKKGDPGWSQVPRGSPSTPASGGLPRSCFVGRAAQCWEKERPADEGEGHRGEKAFSWRAMSHLFQAAVSNIHEVGLCLLGQLTKAPAHSLSHPGTTKTTVMLQICVHSFQFKIEQLNPWRLREGKRFASGHTAVKMKAEWRP